MRAFPYQSIYDQSANPPWDRLTGASDHRIEAFANWTDGVYPGGWETTPGVGMSVVVSPGMGRIRGIFVMMMILIQEVYLPRVGHLQFRQLMKVWTG